MSRIVNRRRPAIGSTSSIRVYKGSQSEAITPKWTGWPDAVSNPWLSHGGVEYHVALDVRTAPRRAWAVDVAMSVAANATTHMFERERMPCVSFLGSPGR